MSSPDLNTEARVGINPATSTVGKETPTKIEAPDTIKGRRVSLGGLETPTTADSATTISNQTTAVKDKSLTSKPEVGNKSTRTGSSPPNEKIGTWKKVKNFFNSSAKNSQQEETNSSDVQLPEHKIHSRPPSPVRRPSITQAEFDKAMNTALDIMKENPAEGLRVLDGLLKQHPGIKDSIMEKAMPGLIKLIESNPDNAGMVQGLLDAHQYSSIVIDNLVPMLLAKNPQSGIAMAKTLMNVYPEQAEKFVSMLPTIFTHDPASGIAMAKSLLESVPDQGSKIIEYTLKFDTEGSPEVVDMINEYLKGDPRNNPEKATSTIKTLVYNEKDAQEILDATKGNLNIKKLWNTPAGKFALIARGIRTHTPETTEFLMKTERFRQLTNQNPRDEAAIRQEFAVVKQVISANDINVAHAAIEKFNQKSVNVSTMSVEDMLAAVEPFESEASQLLLTSFTSDGPSNAFEKNALFQSSSDFIASAEAKRKKAG